MSRLLWLVWEANTSYSVCITIRNFLLLFLPLPFFERFGQWILEMDNDSHKILTDLQSSEWGQCKIIFSPKFFFLFQLFQVQWKTQFSQNCQSIQELFVDYDQGTQVQQKVCGMNGGCRKTYFPFSRWKMYHLEKH